VLLIFALTLLGIFYPIFKSRKEEKEKAPSQVATGAMVEEVRQSGCDSARPRFLLLPS